MADSAARREPFDDLASFMVRNRLAIEPAPVAARHVLRGPQDAVARVGEAFGLAPPDDDQSRGRGRDARRLHARPGRMAPYRRARTAT